MSQRYRDRIRQARRDLEHSVRSLQDGDYEWACFAAQQAGEKAVKAVYQRAEAERAVDYAQRVIAFCEGRLV